MAISGDLVAVPAPHAFAADRPIKSSATDRFNRGDFAKGLAESVLSWRGSDGLVIGLYGPWGSGKTSLINLVLERLQSDDHTPPIITFNPWEWSGHEELATSFFQEIEAALRGQELRESSRLADLFEKYAAILRAGAAATDSAAPIVLAAATLLVAAGGTTILVDQLDSTIGSSILMGLGAIGIIASRIEAAMEALAAAVRRHEEPPRSLESVKDDLAGALQGYERNILVIVDDLDRLTPNDAIRMLQLVKANADLPKMVYLLAFEHTALSTSIAAALRVNGADYIEKIVQVPLHLPKPGKADLERMLTAALDRIVDNEPIRKRFAKERWATLFLDDLRAPGINSFFTTPRQVSRFASAVEFDFNRHLDRGECSVDPVDFIGVEVLRVFHADAYDSLPPEKAVLTGGTSSDSGEQKRAQDALQRILRTLPDGPRRAAGQHILTELFPAAEWAVTGVQQGTNRDRLLAERRVSHPDMFDFYFQMAVPSTSISKGEIEQIVQSASRDKGTLTEALRDLRNRSLLREFLNHLQALSSQIPQGREDIVIGALFDIGDELEAQVERMLDVSDTLRSEFIIEDLLRRLPEDRRLHVLEQAVADAEGIALPATFVRFELHARGRGDAAIGDKDGLRSLGETIAGRISQRAAEGTLTDNRHLVELIVCWQDFGAPGDAASWAEQQARTPQGLLRLFRAFKGYARSDSKHPLADYIDLDAAIRNAQHVVESGDLEEPDRSALRDELGTLLTTLRQFYNYEG